LACATRRAADVTPDHGALLLATATADDSICPPASERTRRTVARFLSKPDPGGDRLQAGIAHQDTSTIRPLVDSTDATVCEHFVTQMPQRHRTRPWTWAFYEADGFYFMVIHSLCEGVCLLHDGILAVFDKDL